MTSMEDFFTRDKANEGVKLPLYLPDGNKSDHFLTIRGVDSDAFREADINSRRTIFDISQIKDEEEKQKRFDLERVKLIAALVIGWSFDKECTQDNVVDFLISAPQIRDAIDKVAGDRKVFFALKSNS